MQGPQLSNDNWSCTGLIFLKSVLVYSKRTLCTLHTVYADFQFHSACARHSFSVSSGLDERDAAFMQRLRNLAQEALTWPHLGERQRLVWAAAVELDAVPLQDHLQGLELTGISSWGIKLCCLLFAILGICLTFFFSQKLAMCNGSFS